MSFVVLGQVVLSCREPSPDFHRRHGSFPPKFPEPPSVHLLRRRLDAAGGLALPLLRSILLHLHQQSGKTRKELQLSFRSTLSLHLTKLSSVQVALIIQVEPIFPISNLFVNKLPIKYWTLSYFHRSCAEI